MGTMQFNLIIWSGIDFIAYSTIVDQSRMIRKTTTVAMHMVSRMQAKLLLFIIYILLNRHQEKVLYACTHTHMTLS